MTAARNRENAIFTNYQTFAKAGLDPQSTDKTVSGCGQSRIWTWCSTPVIPLRPSPWCPPSRSPSCPPRVTEFSSPSGLGNGSNASLEPLDTLSSRAKTGTIVLVAVGGVLLLSPGAVGRSVGAQA